MTRREAISEWARHASQCDTTLIRHPPRGSETDMRRNPAMGGELSVVRFETEHGLGEQDG